MAQTQGEYGAAGTKNKKAPSTPLQKKAAGYGKIGFTASSAVPNLPAAPKKPSYGGGGGSRGYGGGGGGVGSNRTGGITGYAAPPAPPAPPTLEAFSAKDSTYQSQLAALKKALADYQAQQGQAKTQYLTSYAGDRRTLGENRTQGLDDLGNDFASRGMLQSGLYADSLSDLNSDFDKRQAALDQARAAFLAQQGSDFTNYQSEQQIAQQKALQEAAARRAAQYGG
jgi:hypothetical protein